jgi:hypothetical protein
MNSYLVSIALILSLMGCVVALDYQNGVEMRPGEAAAERLFEKGIGQPWVGGNPTYSNAWGWGYDPFVYYHYQGKTYWPHYYYLYPGGISYPIYYGQYYYYP